MSVKLKCPICNKRAMDVVKAAKGKMVIEMKCPHCHKIVKINYSQS